MRPCRMRSTCSVPSERFVASTSTTYSAWTVAPYFAARSTACSTALSAASLPSVGIRMLSYIVLVVCGRRVVRAHDVLGCLLAVHRFGAVTLPHHLLGLHRRFRRGQRDGDGHGEHEGHRDE